jgi:hypothetical protein
VADNGIVIIGNQTVGYTERNIYVYWDISPDLMTQRHIALEVPYYLVMSAREIAHQHIQYIYNTRWMHVEYEPTPITERHIFIHYALCLSSERVIYYYPDTRERLMYSECLLVNTPLIMKYPKYYNWAHVPQILSPSFLLWSFYPLDYENITVQLIGSSGNNIIKNSLSNNADFRIEKIAEYQYNVSVAVNHVFAPGETVTCYVTAYDSKGNYLKPGMW